MHAAGVASRVKSRFDAVEGAEVFALKLAFRREAPTFGDTHHHLAEVIGRRGFTEAGLGELRNALVHGRLKRRRPKNSVRTGRHVFGRGEGLQRRVQLQLHFSGGIGRHVDVGQAVRTNLARYFAGGSGKRVFDRQPGFLRRPPRGNIFSVDRSRFLDGCLKKSLRNFVEVFPTSAIANLHHV